MVDPYHGVGITLREQSKQAFVEQIDRVLKDIHEKVSPYIIAAKHARERFDFFGGLEILFRREDRTDHEQTLELLTSIMIRNKITIIEQKSHSNLFGQMLASTKMKLLDLDPIPLLPSSMVLDSMVKNNEYFLDLHPPYSSGPLKAYFEKYYGAKYYEKVPINFSDEESFDPINLTPIELEFKVPFSAVNNLVMQSLQTLDQESMIKFAQQRLHKKESYVQGQIKEVLEDLIFAIAIKEEKTIEQRLTASVEIVVEAIPVDWSVNLRRLSHNFPEEDTLGVEEKELKELQNPDLGETTTKVQGLLQTPDFDEEFCSVSS